MGIFFVGLFVTALCLFGLYFSIAEINRLGRDSDARVRALKR
ncbi:MAG: hypothetical protein ABI024_13920 [Vicinamibacterales bacterium]